MGQPFPNEVAGGNGTLLIPAIQSPNFSLAGQTGWAILQNGNAFFFSITAEGTITATTFLGTDFEITSTGAFFYNGTPAVGNLIAAIVPASTTQDPLGNSVVAGSGAYVNVPGGATPGVYSVNLGALSSPVPNFAALTIGNLTHAPNAPAWFAASNNTSGAISAVGSGQSGATTGVAELILYDAAAAPRVSGFGLTGSELDLIATGMVFTPVPVLSDQWHVVNLAAAGSNWGNQGGAFANLSYRLSNDGGVEIDAGRLVASATSVATIFTLPAGYIPAHTQAIWGWDFTANSGVQWTVSNAGAVIIGTAPVNGHTYAINGKIDLRV